MVSNRWRVHNPSGSRRVIVTKELPGARWLRHFDAVDCRVEICTSSEVLNNEEIVVAIGQRCDGAIGQLTETWGADLFAALKAAGGRVYSNYAVGYNNVDIKAATEYGIPVGNTPGVLTETTAQLAMALTFAAARRVVEGDRFMRAGRFHGWLPDLFLGELLWRGTVGIIGAGRIGTAYAKAMVEGCRMNLLYYDINRNEALEDYIVAYDGFLRARGECGVTCRRMGSLDDLLKQCDVVSLHTVLDETTRHMIDATRLAMMKEDAILVNSSRGPLIDETSLVEHCRRNPSFRVGLDVYENEPQMAPGLAELDNVVIVPHLGSATSWTRQAMAALASANTIGVLQGYRLWGSDDMFPFLGENPPQAIPSLVNGVELGFGTERD